MAETGPQAESKLAQASRLIRYHAVGAAAAGLVPIPFVDLAAIAGVQVNLIRSLAKLYELPFSEEVGKSIITGLIGATLPLSALAFLKAFPVIAVLGSSAVSAASTYAVGKVFVQHFESGGTFLDLDPAKVRAHYLRELRKQASSDAETLAAVEEEDYGGIRP